MDDLKILVGCHKPCECPDIVKKHKDIYIPILAGAAESNIEPFWPGMIRDDIMDNISWLNPYYSEYTCLYWAWKNYDMIGNPEYFGFAQYHRFLNPDLFLNKLHPNKVLQEGTQHQPRLQPETGVFRRHHPLRHCLHFARLSHPRTENLQPPQRRPENQLYTTERR